MIYKRDDNPGGWSARRIGAIVVAWGIVTLAVFLIGTFWPAEGHRRPHLWETLAIPGAMLVVGAVLLARGRGPTTTPEWLYGKLIQFGDDPGPTPPLPDRVSDRRYLINRKKPQPRRPHPEFRPGDVIRSEDVSPGGQSHIYVREDLAKEGKSDNERHEDRQRVH